MRDNDWRLLALLDDGHVHATRVDDVKVARIRFALFDKLVAALQRQLFHVLHGAEQLLRRHLGEEKVGANDLCLHREKNRRENE